MLLDILALEAFDPWLANHGMPTPWVRKLLRLSISLALGEGVFCFCEMLFAVHINGFLGVAFNLVDDAVIVIASVMKK
jgi:hypothetical protein